MARPRHRSSPAEPATRLASTGCSTRRTSPSKSTIFSLLGPKGAGKTRMVRVLSTLISADAGDIPIAGHDPAKRGGRNPGGDRSHQPVLRGGQPAHRRHPDGTFVSL